MCICIIQANGLRSGTWYEIRVVARSAAGDTTAIYRAATHTHNGGKYTKCVLFLVIIYCYRIINIRNFVNIVDSLVLYLLK